MASRETKTRKLAGTALPVAAFPCFYDTPSPMKTLARLIAATVALPAAVFAAPFEGKVNFKMTSEGKPQEMVYNIKGDKIRLEMPGVKGMGGMILDTAKKETTMIMDDQKMYMTMAMPEATDARGGKNDEATLEKTNETEKILGYTATKYISTHQGTTTEMWLAEGLGTFMSFNNSNPMGGGRRGGGAAPQAWERALAGKELFPLRVVGKNKSGKESFRMETTAINKQSLPDSMFAPPAGYQKFDMGGMMKGMMPGAGR
jgi:hypothetical protein